MIGLADYALHGWIQIAFGLLIAYTGLTGRKEPGDRGPNVLLWVGVVLALAGVVWFIMKPGY